MKCSIEGCGNDSGVPGSARGWCRAHYRRWQRYGNVDEPLRRVKTWKGEKCSVVGCNKDARIQGLCVNDYAQKRRNIDPSISQRAMASWTAKKMASQEDAMGRSRTEVCEICGLPPYGRWGKHGKDIRICFDHDHATGKPRGWLCDRCNKVLGLVKDSSILLKKLTSYLEIHSGKTDDKTA